MLIQAPAVPNNVSSEAWPIKNSPPFRGTVEMAREMALEMALEVALEMALDAAFDVAFEMALEMALETALRSGPWRELVDGL